MLTSSGGGRALTENEIHDFLLQRFFGDHLGHQITARGPWVGDNVPLICSCGDTLTLTANMIAVGKVVTMEQVLSIPERVKAHVTTVPLGSRAPVIPTEIRVPVLGGPDGRTPGTISWDEHMQASINRVTLNRYRLFAKEGSEDARRVADHMHACGGFSYRELVEDLLGYAPKTWRAK